MTQTESRISKAAAADGERRRPKVGLEKLLDNRELRQACTSCRISVYWEGEDEYFKVRDPSTASPAACRFASLWR